MKELGSTTRAGVQRCWEVAAPSHALKTPREEARLCAGGLAGWEALAFLEKRRDEPG